VLRPFVVTSKTSSFSQMPLLDVSPTVGNKPT